MDECLVGGEWQKGMDTYRSEQLNNSKGEKELRIDKLQLDM